jgi:hypothetical protein
MADQASNRVFTLMRREMQEHNSGLLWTPVITGVLLILLMAASVVLANRISAVGDTLLRVMLQEESIAGMSITINIDDDESADDGLEPPRPLDPSNEQFTIETETGPVDEEAWNFSREWNFTPKARDKNVEVDDERLENLNPALNVLHVIFLFVLLIATVNYLLGSLYNDRKDRSILFWKSMPVSEWEEVLAKLGVALLVAPAIAFAVLAVTQIAYVLLAMLLVSRMGYAPMDTVVANIEFAPLFLGQIGGWLLAILWVAPVYAYLMLASAGARRSPFMLAVTPVAALLILEGVFLGSNFVGQAIVNHIPHNISGRSAVALHFGIPDLGSLNYLSMVLGLLFTAGALWATVYLRRYRFEI